jgi:mono/diheme cytochrome c family protein
MDAKGTNRAPDLTDNVWSQITGTYDEIVQLVTTGVPKAKVKMPGAPFGMNPRGGIQLTDAQIREVAAYVYTLSHK